VERLEEDIRKIEGEIERRKDERENLGPKRDETLRRMVITTELSSLQRELDVKKGKLENLRRSGKETIIGMSETLLVGRK
jgi:predicted RNase H-like nuclease (RuvC/YqgF family)